MAVVVNEVEVTPAERSAEATQEKGGGEQTPPSEHEIRRLLEQQATRCERVWAY
ncbi:MAG TPA: hypothetical protein VGQ41_23510 [Pyrinomonadaceae bacterium]|jgi:hypothetical protein|nr:hypothetical protein [Pyrinomonadaceae bacterium]